MPPRGPRESCPITVGQPTAPDPRRRRTAVVLDPPVPAPPPHVPPPSSAAARAPATRVPVPAAAHVCPPVRRGLRHCRPHAAARRATALPDRSDPAPAVPPSPPPPPPPSTPPPAGPRPPMTTPDERSMLLRSIPERTAGSGSVAWSDRLRRHGQLLVHVTGPARSPPNPAAPEPQPAPRCAARVLRSRFGTFRCSVSH
jgi:hypothetical protein